MSQKVVFPPSKTDWWWSSNQRKINYKHIFWTEELEPRRSGNSFQWTSGIRSKGSLTSTKTFHCHTGLFKFLIPGSVWLSKTILAKHIKSLTHHKIWISLISRSLNFILSMWLTTLWRLIISWWWPRMALGSRRFITIKDSKMISSYKSRSLALDQVRLVT